MRLRLAAVVTFAGLAASLGLTQPPPKDAKTPPAKPADPAKPAPKPPGKSEGVTEQVFKSADGVKVAARFYRGAKASGSVVIMLGASGQKTDDPAWTSTAADLAGRGFHVVTFDHRGSGGSTDIVPNEFFTNQVNRQLVAGANQATKVTVTTKDFRGGYYPMLVQDLAAVRNGLDQMNDTGDVNTSTIYLVGAGDAAGLGLFFLATEWFRERQKPNLAVAPNYVSPNRGLFVGAEPAGRDYGGAVWISPTLKPEISAATLKRAVLSPAAIELRSETPMLFIYGSKDGKAKAGVQTITNSVLNAPIPKKGAKLTTPQTTFEVQIDKADAAGASGLKLLGNNSGTEEKIVEFLNTKETERKSRTRKNRDWEKPLIIDVGGFGFGPRQP